MIDIKTLNNLNNLIDASNRLSTLADKLDERNIVAVIFDDTRINIPLLYVTQFTQIVAVGLEAIRGINQNEINKYNLEVEQSITPTTHVIETPATWI